MSTFAQILAREIAKQQAATAAAYAAARREQKGGA